MSGFINTDQQAEAIQTFLEATRLTPFQGKQLFHQQGIWQYTEAFETLWQHRSKLSHGEQIVLNVAYELWTYDKMMPMFDLFSLSPNLALLILSLYQAIILGPNAVAVWINSHRSNPDE